MEILKWAPCATVPETEKGRRLTIQPDFVLIRNEVTPGLEVYTLVYMADSEIYTNIYMVYTMYR